MCGRYSADGKVNTLLAARYRCMTDGILRVGDIRPGERAPVIIAGRPAPLVVSMTWGMQGKNRLIINARKETLWDKPSFRNLVQNRRCLVPASCFYEWDSEKRKATLCGKESDVLFMAGVYQAAADVGSFAIITAPADGTVKPIHDRMPVLVPWTLVTDWLSDVGRAAAILDSANVPLRREQRDEQLSLWE